MTGLHKVYKQPVMIRNIRSQTHIVPWKYICEPTTA